MRNISIFKFYSRIGLMHKPNRQKHVNIGVEGGPDAILTKEFLQQFTGAKVHTFSFPLPEDIEKKDEIDALVSSSIQAKKLIEEKISTKDTQVVIGGDHSITFPSFLAVLKRYKNKKIGYVQIDSHGDMNLWKDSPTKNWHGMYVRPCIDIFDMPKIEKLVKKKLPVQHVWFFGNLDLDPEEKKFFKKSNIKNTTPEELAKNNEAIKKKFKKFCHRMDHVHITVDIDAFDKSIAPATGIPAESGFFWKHIAPILTIVSQHKSISVDVSEVNPRKRGAKKTIMLAQRILAKLLL